jgi:TetR/AcrR family transcriptional regulator, cholesterol catabolism regulator
LGSENRAMAASSDAALANKIRASAVKLFRARGYEAVTIDDIVTEIGSTKGSFYYYFKSKGELLLTLYREYVNFSVDCFRKAFAAAASSPERQIEAFVYESWRQIHEHQDYVGLLFDERRSLPEDGVETVKESQAELRVMLAEVIRRGVAEGVFRPVDVRSAALAIFGMCTWGYLWYKPGGRVGHEELSAEFTQIALRGLIADKKPA